MMSVLVLVSCVIFHYVFLGVREDVLECCKRMSKQTTKQTDSLAVVFICEQHFPFRLAFACFDYLL